ncbi:MAG: hypothetical protein AAGK77_13525, partial [Pseudomonadota bacterium]
MAGYISEIKYYGQSDVEFVEIALPQGTDPSGYQIVQYDGAGNVISTLTLGSPVATMDGHDVYVLDDRMPGFETTADFGRFYADDAIALVDGSGNVQQFISWEGNTVSPSSGPAAGMTSTNIGNISSANQSMQSNDGGATYFAQD